MAKTAKENIGAKPAHKKTGAKPAAGPEVAVIVLTTGTREDELSELARSLSEIDTRCDVEFCLVSNGVTREQIPPFQIVTTEKNLGVGGGRNAGVAATSAEVMIFIDDDALIRTPDLIDQVYQRFATEADLGVIAFRICVPGSEQYRSEWSPRLGANSGNKAGAATTFVGAGHAIRRRAFQDVGGYFEPLFFGLEETDLSWRLLDRGWRIDYDTSLVVQHPDVAQSRHAGVKAKVARNRVWIAQRNLGPVTGFIYIANWLTIGILRSRSVSEIVEITKATLQALKNPQGPRQPIRLSTVIAMFKAGRPPII